MKKSLYKRSASTNISCMLIDIILADISFILSWLSLRGLCNLHLTGSGMIFWTMCIYSVCFAFYFYSYDLYDAPVIKTKELIVCVILSNVFACITNMILLSFIFFTFSLNLTLIVSSVGALILTLVWRICRQTYIMRKTERNRLIMIENKSDDKSRLKRLKYSVLNQYDAWYEQYDFGNPNKDEFGKMIADIANYEAVCILDNVPDDIKDKISNYATMNEKELFIVPDDYDLVFVNMGVQYFDDVVSFKVKIPKLNSYQRLIKRFCDIILSLIGIVLTGIPMLFIAALIRLTSEGPAIYTQERLTYGKEHFKIYKFRSMVNDAEKFSGPALASKDDPRITKIGKILRKTRMDELPQFFNILMGDMSLVGPRPERPFFVDQYSDTIKQYDMRFNVKAGLTSLSHVYGRYNTNINDRTLFDLLYLRNYSIYLDFKIVLLTAKIVFMKEAAEGLDKKK